MKEPLFTREAACPNCHFTAWKLARVFVMQGTSRVEAKTDGSAVGGSIGIGGGQGGLAVGYQSVDATTSGTLASDAALSLSPPTAPPNYDRKLSLLTRCDELMSDAENCLRLIDGFADERSGMSPPGLFNRGSNRVLNNIISEFLQLIDQLAAMRSYEQQLATWERTRVCERCGTPYVVDGDELMSIVPFELPELRFNGIERKCRKCGSYGWKTGTAFFDMSIRQIEAEIDRAKSAKAAADSRKVNATRPGIVRRVWEKAFPPPTVEACAALVSEAEARLASGLAFRDEVSGRFDGLDDVRVCSDCNTIWSPSHPPLPSNVESGMVE